VRFSESVGREVTTAAARGRNIHRTREINNDVEQVLTFLADCQAVTSSAQSCDSRRLSAGVRRDGRVGAAHEPVDELLDEWLAAALLRVVNPL
jgi:hypothetical protein